ncbi:MAG: TetR/AcrR family transcriptional regulator [Gemmatimonadota bacterium]
MTDPSVTQDLPVTARLDPRARRPAEEREAQIIDAAFTAFAATGLDETRLEDIARLAGVAKGTIYLYFPNKEALFREMIRRTVVVRLDALESAPHDPDPLRDFDRVVRTYWSYVTEPQFPVLYRLVTGVLPRLPELSQFFAERVSLRWQKLLQSCVDACVRDGSFGPEQAPEAARMLHALLMQHALMRANPTLCSAIHLDDADAVLDRVLGFFRAALRPAAPSPA